MVYLHRWKTKTFSNRIENTDKFIKNKFGFDIKKIVALQSVSEMKKVAKLIKKNKSDFF